MSSIKELKEKIAIERARAERKKEKAELEKELFNLRHARKIAILGKVKDTAVHMGKNAGAMIKEQSKKSKKKKKGGFEFPTWDY